MRSVAIVMGSDSDEPIMSQAAQALDEFKVQWTMRVLSAHRTPEEAATFAREADREGIGVIIAGAGGAAHLAGVLAALTTLPVIGVPIALKNLDGLDSLLSMVQMPRGIPVATVAIDGARNAGLLAVRILGVGESELRAQMETFQHQLADEVRAKDRALSARLVEDKSPSQ